MKRLYYEVFGRHFALFTNGILNALLNSCIWSLHATTCIQMFVCIPNWENQHRVGVSGQMVTWTSRWAGLPARPLPARLFSALGIKLGQSYSGSMRRSYQELRGFGCLAFGDVQTTRACPTPAQSWGPRIWPQHRSR